MVARDYDVIVVGSGFGGSVTALRLTEKGYRVGVLEAGRRWRPEDFPRTNWDLRNFIWNPRLGLRGIQRITLLQDVLIFSAAGVGGGSLVYANTLYEPLSPFYRDRQWAHITDWREELAPFYDQAKRMFGATATPFETPAEDVMRAVAERMGVAETFTPTPTGVYYGDPGRTVPDPYFGGAGPDRTGCIRCGACMIGCRHNAKNTLDRNYLYLAEAAGAVIHPEQQVVDLEPLPEGGYRLTAVRPGPKRAADPTTYTARQVVLSAGALGTLRLLLDLRDRGRLPRLSPRLGDLVRTNSEALLGVTARQRDVDYSKGVAIGSSIHPDTDTHIEPVRYPKGSNMMGLLATLLVESGGRLPQPLRFLVEALRHPVLFLRSLSVYRWSERTVIVLVMQSLDNSLRVRLRRGLFGPRLVTRQGHGQPNPSHIPQAHEAARIAAEVMDGVPGATWNEAVLNVPSTAHIIGGAVIGDSPERGVVDPYHRVFGHPGLHVADGSVITANLGVNPSLTITALAERAMSMWPNNGEPDPRPDLGQPYRQVAAMLPRSPTVPDDAPAALRLPLVT